MLHILKGQSGFSQCFASIQTRNTDLQYQTWFLRADIWENATTLLDRVLYPSTPVSQTEYPLNRFQVLFTLP